MALLIPKDKSYKSAFQYLCFRLISIFPKAGNKTGDLIFSFPLCHCQGDFLPAYLIQSVAFYVVKSNISFVRKNLVD